MARQTVYAWLRQYAAAGGTANLANRSSSCPHQMPAAVESRMLALRLAHPGWGPDRIVFQLARDRDRGELTGRLPSWSAVYRALVRHRLLDPARRRRRRADYRRWERGPGDGAVADGRDGWRDGVPEQILTDNGKVFTDRFATGAGTRPGSV